MTDPYLQLYGEPRGSQRLVYEFEIAVTDPIQAAAYLMDVQEDEDGELGVTARSNQNHQAALAATRVMSTALREQGPTAGFRLISASPAVPARDDDGNLL